MGTAFYIMAILGCSDSEVACHQVRIDATRYVSADACASATGDALMRHSDISYPVVMARCRPAGEAVAESMPELPQG